MPRWVFVGGGACLVGLAACNAILSIGDYRACQGAECDGGSVDGADASDAGQQTCGSSAECPASAPVCSSGACASVISLARGMSNFTCAVLSDRTARCWGQNDHGQLGTGVPSSTWVAKPAIVVDSSGTTPLKRISTIVTGLGYACALTVDETVYCWGNDSASPNIVPTQIPLGQVKQISGAAGVNSGEGTVCAVHGGGASCWGLNGAGRMGCASIDGGVCSTLTPTSIDPQNPQLIVPTSIAVAVGTYAMCSLVGQGGGGYECFGSDSYGNCGDGQQGAGCCVHGTGLAQRPTDRIEPSDFFTCFHDNMNAWWCWGLSQGGAILGVPRDGIASSPKKIAPDGTYSDLSPGWYHSCAITNDANAYVQCWGQYDHGQMGDNVSAPSPAYRSSPVTAHGLQHVTQLAAHRNFTCALNGDGQVYCWGENANAWLLGASSPGGDVKEPTPVRWD